MIFLTPSPLGALPPDEVASTGPEIVDSQGRAVWFLPLPAGQVSSDLRVQTYMEKTVLTWGQGTGFQVTVPGSTTDYICDTSYNVIASFQAGNGYNADLHEFLVTPQNTALITVYANVPMDLSSMGGPANGTVVEGIVQEIDIATGAVVFEWHSLDHVPLSDSYVGAPSSGAYDYFHINSVNLDTDGNLLVSSRHTWTVYKVNRTTGAVIWRLGGKSTDFTLGPGLPFAWQHNAVAVDSQTIRIFDNESDGVPVLPASRVIWVQHDDTTMTATLVRSIQHPDGLSVPAEGDGQALSNGDTFVGWGILGRYSEFDPNGNLIYDASLPPGYNDYRSYRFPWAATPTGSPSVLAQTNGAGTTAVHAVWNGATQVATWTILGGSAPGALSEVGTMAWNGLDTSTTVQGLYSYVEVVATDASGAAVGTSQAQGVAPAFATQPASQTIGDDGRIQRHPGRGLGRVPVVSQRGRPVGRPQRQRHRLRLGRRHPRRDRRRNRERGFVRLRPDERHRGDDLGAGRADGARHDGRRPTHQCLGQGHSGHGKQRPDRGVCRRRPAGLGSPGPADPGLRPGAAGLRDHRCAC
jgi:hypothetical protein